jgi:hypothetical protein
VCSEYRDAVSPQAQPASELTDLVEEFICSALVQVRVSAVSALVASPVVPPTFDLTLGTRIARVNVASASTLLVRRSASRNLYFSGIEVSPVESKLSFRGCVD